MIKERKHPPTFLMSLTLMPSVTALVVIWLTPLVDRMWMRFALTGGVFYLSWRVVGWVLDAWKRRREEEAEKPL
jgi:hypothetical protein